MQQLTKEQAIAFANSDEWKKMDSVLRFVFQMSQELLCMPFSEFHKAAEKALKRPVWTHEFVDKNSLIAEFNGIKNTPSFEEIVDKLGKNVGIVLV